MPEEAKHGLMVKYQFEVDDESWRKWKNTVPRSKSLDQRIIELIEADTEGRVQPPEEDDIAESDSSASRGEGPDAGDAPDHDTFETAEEASSGVKKIRGDVVSRSVVDDETEERIRDSLAGSGDLLDARLNEVLKMYMELQRRGEATKEELLSVVDVEATDYQDEKSVWSNMVKGKDTLKAIPDVEEPSAGKSTWKCTGERGE